MASMTEPARGGKLGHFRTEEARHRFEVAYDRALALWPTVPRAIDVATSYGSTRVNACGAATGTPVVLLHGMMATSTSWGPNVTRLGEHHPLFAVDAICDTGRSVQRRPVRDRDDLEQWFLEVLDGLELGRTHVIGLSYGAWIAINHALRSPERVVSVTAVEPPGVITRGRVAFSVRFLKAAVTRSDKDFARIVDMLSGGNAPAEPLVEVLHCGFRDFKPGLPFAKLLKDDELRSLAPPMLLLFGARSPMSDGARAVERARTLVPHVEADLLAGTAHTPPLERPDLFDERVCQFLDRVESAADR